MGRRPTINHEHDDYKREMNAEIHADREPNFPDDVLHVMLIPVTLRGNIIHDMKKASTVTLFT